MTAATHTNVGTQVYRVYIKASPQAIWDAITSPEWTVEYGYGGIAQYDPDSSPAPPTGDSRTRPCGRWARPR